MFFPDNVKLSQKSLIADNTKNYNKKLSEAKSRLNEYNLLAAEEVYVSANDSYQSAISKKDFQNTYYSFERVGNYIKNYKNTNSLRNESFEKGIMKVAVLNPANSSGQTDTRFNIINTVVNRIRSNIGKNQWITPVSIQNQSIGSYSNNYSGIKADLVIKITFNSWDYGENAISSEPYSNQKTKTKKNGEKKVWNVSGTIIKRRYYANYDVIVEAISTSDNVIEKSNNLRLEYDQIQGWLVGKGDSRANDSDFPIVSKIDPYFSPGNNRSLSTSPKKISTYFANIFEFDVTKLVSGWY